MDCSTPGLPVHHQLLEFTQTHTHWVRDAIQPSHPLSSPSPPTFNLISFRMDWLDLLAVQGTLKSLLQHYSSKVLILRRSVFFIVQLSHPYMTSGKTVDLTSWTFVGKVMSLLFNMLSSLVITFLPRSKRLLISWLQSPSAVIFSSVQSLSHVQLFETPWTAARQASLSIANSRTNSNSCPLSRWCHPTISFALRPISKCFAGSG